MAANQHNSLPILSRYIVDERGCWIYQGEITRRGYGSITLGQRRDGNRVRIGAHRYFYQQLVGPIPDGMKACHKCDVPACVNPEHIFLGTDKDNIRDMHHKGRYHHAGAKGERNHFAKITEETARAILAAEGTQKTIAAKYGVAQTTVQAIKVRRIWKHL